MRNQTYRILAENQTMSNDTWQTGLNNNDLIIGPSGAGKTRGYVKPNILLGNESMIIADTKNTLIEEMKEPLRKMGYQVIHMDFMDILASYGYNPLDFIRYDKKRKCYMEQDIITVAAGLVPIENFKDPFWDQAARMYLESMIGYVLECLPKEEHTLTSVAVLYSEMGTGRFQRLIMELSELNPKSFAVERYNIIRYSQRAERMHASIQGILAEKLSVFTFAGTDALFQKKERIRFAELGRKKTAVFLNISDTDRSMDKLANLFYTQALQTLCDSADKDEKNHRLKVPVRFILDDFAANVCIPDFDRIISVIRSREISVSIILQSISQLESLYGHARAMTILNNCDNCLYLGGQDVETAKYISIKANKSANTILNMPLDEAWLFTRGREPQKVRKFVPESSGAKNFGKGTESADGKKEVTPKREVPRGESKESVSNAIQLARMWGVMETLEDVSEMEHAPEDVKIRNTDFFLSLAKEYEATGQKDLTAFFTTKIEAFR